MLAKVKDASGRIGIFINHFLGPDGCRNFCYVGVVLYPRTDDITIPCHLHHFTLLVLTHDTMYEVMFIGQKYNILKLPLICFLIFAYIISVQLSNRLQMIRIFVSAV